MNDMSYLEMSHPERRAEETEAARETAETRAARVAALYATAKEIRVYQEQMKPVPSDKAFVSQYPALGSTTTYQKLRDAAEERAPDVWLPKYQGVLSSLRLAAMAAPADEIYEDMLPAQAIGDATQRLLLAHGKDRLVVVEGCSGSGKTEGMRLVAKRLGGAMVIVDADDTWRSPRVALQDILRALGVGECPGTTVECRDMLIRMFIDRQYIIAIDEGHHMCATTLNMIKLFINRSPVKFIVAAQATLWRKLTAIASEEAMQLLHNRMHTRVRLAAPTADDAGKFLARRLGISKDLPHGMVAETARQAAGNGHYSFLRRVADHLEKEHAGPGLAASDLSARIAAATIAARNEVKGN
jgi:hypothetical protein